MCLRTVLNKLHHINSHLTGLGKNLPPQLVTLVCLHTHNILGEGHG